MGTAALSLDVPSGQGRSSIMFPCYVVEPSVPRVALSVALQLFCRNRTHLCGVVIAFWQLGLLLAAANFADCTGKWFALACQWLRRWRECFRTDQHC